MMVKSKDLRLDYWGIKVADVVLLVSNCVVEYSSDTIKLRDREHQILLSRGTLFIDSHPTTSVMSLCQLP